MRERIIKRNFRQPFAAIAVILFATVLTVALCYLDQAKRAEEKSFEEAYASVPVYFKITDLDGSRVTTKTGIQGWMADLFLESRLWPPLTPYIGEVSIRIKFNAYWQHMEYLRKGDRWVLMPVSDPVMMTGITSTQVAQELTAGMGGSIHWAEGYDESIFATDQFVCIVPEHLKDEKEMDFLFEYKTEIFGERPKNEAITRTFQVVGYFTDPGNNRAYCPYLTLEWINARLGCTKNIEEIGAILKDNNQLEEMKEIAAYWFAEPNPSGAKTHWGRFEEYYIYALDIDDNMLRSLSSDMKTSMRINQFASAMVFLMSAAAGFLTGFLVIRSRKREVILMRTIGAPQKDIFKEFFTEQIVFVGIGIFLGGIYVLWRPILQLLLFLAIYGAGLAVALKVFLDNNLLTVIKEEE